ncbi:MAG: hypothetical protein D6702_04575, partial [Planctomycetota bacterium]
MLLAALLLVCGAPVPAQGTEVGPVADDRAPLAAELLDLGLADRHAFVLLRDLVETAPHRLAGSPGYAAAA